MVIFSVNIVAFVCVCVCVCVLVFMHTQIFFSIRCGKHGTLHWICVWLSYQLSWNQKINLFIHHSLRSSLQHFKSGWHLDQSSGILQNSFLLFCRYVYHLEIYIARFASVAEIMNCYWAGVKAKLFMIALLSCPEDIPVYFKCLGTIYLIVL